MRSLRFTMNGQQKIRYGIKYYKTLTVLKCRQTTELQPQQHFYPTHIEHIASLDVMGNRVRRRQAGIICTIGPASRKIETIVKMMESGMNIARLNFSHGTTEYHLETIRNIRKANEIFNEKQKRLSPVGIALDTKGPEIRTGWLKDGSISEIQLNKGDEVTLTTDKKYLKEVTASKIYVDYKNMPKIVVPDSIVYVDDGLISLKVLKIEGENIRCRVENGGKLGSTKGVNLPGTLVDLPALSEKDKKDILFAVENNLDIIFASFIRNKEAIEEIKKLTDVQEDKSLRIAVIAKIENQQGMDNVDDIISVADGLMVARGDLGIELPPERIFLAQKSMIAKCNLVGKPIICATQMLESMVKNPRPTRAETSDVANAVLDGADCVMLSGETAKGSFPVECVRVMSKVCREAEAAVPYRQLFIDLSKMVHPPAPTDLSAAIAGVAAAEKSLASAIIVITSTGTTAHLLSKFRPMCPIIAITKDSIIARKCHLYRGVVPAIHTAERDEDWSKDIELRTKTGILAAKSLNILAEGDKIIVLTGWRAGRGATNTMKILTVTKEMLDKNVT